MTGRGADHERAGKPKPGNPETERLPGRLSGTSLDALPPRATQSNVLSAPSKIMV